MWSASILVTTAITGVRCKKDASDSSASATIYSPVPKRALALAASNLPPMTNVGSMPASAKILAIKLVVVVFPWVPATAMPCLKRISSANIMARGTTGIFFARAAFTSGFSSFTAEDTTTTSASCTFSAA